MSQSLVFLHLSDIHFSKRSSSAYDPDLDLRRELVADVVRAMAKVQMCSGILVSGDIAFSGKADEYAKARDWLGELCKHLKCPEEAVWVVPGNHDVDRDAIRASGIIQDKHQRLRQGNHEEEVRRLHEDAEALELLHRPLTGYIRFAGGYDCLPDSRHLFWEDLIELNDKSLLRIRGCNSAIVSNASDDENQNRLVVGQTQMLPPNEPGVVNLVMCHHPLDWLHDRDNLKDNLKARARVCLFGHKHSLRLERLDDTVFIMAGAVHPERNEGKWEPRYNFIGLSVVGEASERTLSVHVWPRIWDDIQKVFKADLDNEGQDQRTYRLPLPFWQPPVATGGPVSLELRNGSEVTAEGKIVNPKRRLVYRFHSLPYVTRMEIVGKLKLVAEEDQDLKEEARQIQYLRRAEQNGILDQLWTAVEQQHGVDVGENPFAKIV